MAFDESQHDRDDHGKFTSGGGLSGLAQKATSLAAKTYARLRGQRPSATAPASEHSQFAGGLRNAAQANVDAAKQHNEAAKEATAAGEHGLAGEHTQAAQAHIDEARSINRQADEHAAIGDNEKDHKEAHDSVAKGASEAEKDAKGHGKGEHEGKDKDHGSESKGDDEEKEGEEKEGLASWVKEKLEGAKEGVHEGFEHATEAEEQALEGDVYKAGANFVGGAVGGVAKKGAKLAVGGLGHQAVASGIQHFAEKYGGAREAREKKEKKEKEKKEKSE